MNDAHNEKEGGPVGAADFEKRAEDKAPGFFREFWDFLSENKKWWLLPIIVSLLLVAAAVILTSSPAAPFIYALF